MGEIDTLNNIINIWKENILIECKTIGSNEELLGIEIDYYDDGENIKLSTSIIFFQENSKLISKGESRIKYISLIDNSNIYKFIKSIYSNSDLRRFKRDEIIKILAKDLCKELKYIQWSSVIKIAEEFYIDVLLNYD